MATLLVKNIHTLVTMDSTRREIRSGALFIRDNIIEQVGTTVELPQTADKILDLCDRHIVLPGFVNTHHHFFQTLTRAIPSAQNHSLFNWLKALFPIWSNLTAEGLYVATQMAKKSRIFSKIVSD
jgi:8-oxoguanine deaminase